MQSDRHARISERAYHIWLAEGGSHGSDIAHWQQAEREIAEEEARVAAALADRAAGRAARPPRAKPATRRTASTARRGRTRTRPEARPK